MVWGLVQGMVWGMVQEMVWECFGDAHRKLFEDLELKKGLRNGSEIGAGDQIMV